MLSVVWVRIKTACFSIKVAKAVCLDSKRHAVTGRADAYTVEKLYIVQEKIEVCLLFIWGWKVNITSISWLYDIDFMRSVFG